jgi:hypothetical protein
VIQEAEKGNPPSKIAIWVHATTISGKQVGRSWLEGFLARYPELSLDKPSALDPKRAKNSTRLS